MQVEISPDFAYVIGVVIFSIFELIWMGMNVGKARKKFEVKYPQMYSDTCDVFNCIQRAHQNTLEGYPTYLVLQIFAGIAFPRVAAAAGFIWCIGKIFYAKGYYTGDPAKRNQGAFAYIGLLTLLGCSVTLALQLKGIV